MKSVMKGMVTEPERKRNCGTPTSGGRTSKKDRRCIYTPQSIYQRHYRAATYHVSITQCEFRVLKDGDNKALSGIPCILMWNPFQNSRLQLSEGHALVNCINMMGEKKFIHSRAEAHLCVFPQRLCFSYAVGCLLAVEVILGTVGKERKKIHGPPNSISSAMVKCITIISGWSLN